MDVWAAGVLAYELMCGRPPFEVADEKETARRIISDTALTFPAHVSEDARSFIRAALCKDPATRPAASELLRHPWLMPYFMHAHGLSDPGQLRSGGWLIGVPRQVQSPCCS